MDVFFARNATSQALDVLLLRPQSRCITSVAIRKVAVNLASQPPSAVHADL